MIERVLVPMDGSEMAERALRYALEAHPDAELTVLTVVGEPTAMFGRAAAIALSEEPTKSVQAYAQPVFDRANEISDEFDISVKTVVTKGHPARAILNRVQDFDAVVIGSHSGSLADRLFVGNIAEKVVRRSPVPVTVVR